MPLETTIRPDPRSYAGVLRALAALARVGVSLRRPLGRIALFVISYARQLLRERFEAWGKKKGVLAKSIAMHLDDMSVRIGSNLKYARIQQEGGVVQPIGHKYLALPVLPELRRSGVYPRDLPRDSMEFAIADIRIGIYKWRGPALVRKSSEFTVKRVQKRTAKGQFAGLGETVDRLVETKKKGEVMFALVRRATIRGRPYLVFNHTGQRFAMAEIRMEYQRAVKAR